eukprot:1897960-Amphidinium_carterae.1
MQNTKTHNALATACLFVPLFCPTHVPTESPTLPCHVATNLDHLLGGPGASVLTSRRSLLGLGVCLANWGVDKRH